jgi:transcriptional regulator with XRE-family HTH domain
MQMNGNRKGLKIGGRLKAILANKKVSQSYLADRSTINPSTINRIVNDGLAASPDQINRIAAALSVSQTDLTGPNTSDRFSQSIGNNPKPLVLDGWEVPFTFVLEGNCTTKLVLNVQYAHTPLALPKSISNNFQRLLKIATERKVKTGTPFFNGPNTRLIGLSINDSYLHHGGEETKVVTLRLGPVSWFEHVVLNEMIDEPIFDPPLRSLRDRYADPSVVYRSVNDLSVVPFSSILTLMLTPLTTDGCAVINRRSELVSAYKGALTSGVTENIFRFKDDWTFRNIDLAVEIPTPPLDKPVTHEYRPVEFPSPYLTGMRGLYEELSPWVYSELRGKDAIDFLCVTFDLWEFHPHLIAVVHLPWSAAELKEIVREYPPHDDYERSETLFVPLDVGASQLLDITRNEKWAPGALAAIIAATKYYRHFKTIKGHKNT